MCKMAFYIKSASKIQLNVSDSTQINMNMTPKFQLLQLFCSGRQLIHWHTAAQYWCCLSVCTALVQSCTGMFVCLSVHLHKAIILAGLRN